MTALWIGLGAIVAGWLVVVAALAVAGRRTAARELAGLVPNVLALFRGLLRDRRVPRRSKVLLVAAVAWIASPIDLIPEFIPVLGPLDDAIVAALALRHIAKVAGPAVLAEHWRGEPATLERLARFARLPGMDRPTVEELAGAMSAAIRDLTEEESRVAVALYRTLAEGDPVAPSAIATRAGVSEERIIKILDAWPAVFRDDDGRVVGFGGLAIPKMGHRFQLEGSKPIHAWCAMDPFLIVPVLGRPARVESADPITGEPVTMTVTPDGVRDVSPPTAVLSFLVPQGELGHDVIQTFCHYVLNFASEESGRQWTADHEGTLLLAPEEGFEIGRRAWRALREAAARTHA